MNRFERGEFKRGQMLTLTLVKEIEKVNAYHETTELRILSDDEGRTHTVKKTPFNEGDKFKQLKPGEEIEYLIADIFPDFSPKLVEVNPPNTSFIQLSDFSKPVEEAFNEIASYYDTNTDFNIRDQYDKGNGNWVWTFLNFLQNIQKDLLNNDNYDGLKKSLLTQREVIETIKKSKFLLSYSEDKRKENKDRLDNENYYAASMLYLIEKLVDCEEDREKEIIKIFDEWLQPVESDLKKFSLKTKLLLKHFEELISNNLFEETATRVEADTNHTRKFLFNKWSWIRKKRMRTALFAPEVENLNPNQSFSLKGNLDLKHLIFLTKFDLDNNSLYEKQATHGVLINSSLLRFQAYFDDEVHKVEKCVAYLLDQTGKDILIDDEYQRKEWRRNYNFEMAHSYRFLAQYSSDIATTIKLYTSSSLFFEKINSVQAIVDQGFVKYFQMAQLIEEKVDLDLIINTSLKELYNLGENKNFVESSHFLSDLKEMFSILSLIGNASESESNSYRLFDIAIRKYDKEDKKSDNLYNSKIAALILASNLLDDENLELLQDQLSKVFSQGVIKVQNYSTAALDVDSEEYKESQLINLISKVESQTLEFKGSWDLDIDLYILPKNERKIYLNKWWGQAKEVSRAVASMLNANRGGKLYIGILEIKDKYKKKGIIEVLQDRMRGVELKGGHNILLGINSELKTKGWDSDLLIQNINNRLKEDIDNSVIQYCLIESKLVKEKEIIEVNIEENSFQRAGWYINDDELPIRENNLIITKRGRTARLWLDEMAVRYNIQ